MYTFWDYCSGLRATFHYKNAIQTHTDENKKLPVSPPALDFCYDCRNNLCVNTTEDISYWITLERIKRNRLKRKFYFCKEECLEDWLEECRALGLWINDTFSKNSPQLEPNSTPKSPEELKI